MPTIEDKVSEEKVTDDIQASEPKEEITQSNSETEEFSKLLEETLDETTEVVEGDVVKGKVVAINDSYLFVSLGGKNEAIAEVDDYKTKSGKLKINIGDELSGFVVKKTDNEIVISKSLNRKFVDKSFLKEAAESKIPVNGKIINTIKGGFSVEILGTRAFCPFSHADSRFISAPQEMVGKYYDFEIIEISDDMRNIILSRKALLNKEYELNKKELFEKIGLNSVVTGKVSRLAPFGAFVDIGGIDGLLHVSQISWAKVDKPADVLKIGDEIEVKIIALEDDRISLSMKALLPNPMEKALEEIKEGDVVNCRIIRNEAFGSFCEIKPGVEGLIPISEMLRNVRVNNPADVVSVGDLVEAQIIKINKESSKISLSLKALQEDPWDHIEEHIKEGELVEGLVDGISNFGVFIKIKEGLTGLLPKSKMSGSNIKLSDSEIGSKVSLRIMQIDRDKKRISLEPIDFVQPENTFTRSYEDRKPKTDWRKYSNNKQEVPEDNPFSNL